MTTFQVTAPGKIILFGEHAVVYHRPAIAVPVSEVYATASLTAMPSGTGLKIVAPNLGQEEWLVHLPAEDPLATIVHLTLRRLGLSHAPDATLEISATIPLGRGLGSGAAVSTAIVRTLTSFYGCTLTPQEISALVYEVEKLYHGTPSGVDNMVIAFEQPVYFSKGQPIRRIKVATPLTLVIADTGRVSPTHKVVGDLRQRWQAEPDLYEGYFTQIGSIVEQARELIEEERGNIIALGRLMDENQAILATLKISSPELDKLIIAARQAGALGAKLSGAGWGGNMIALATPQTAPAIAQMLGTAGATGVIITTVAETQESF
jgi:mevalonate kinase